MNFFLKSITVDKVIADNMGHSVYSGGLIK